MNVPSINNFESLRKAAIAVAIKRASDVFQCEPDFCFTLISRNGIIEESLISSERLAE